MTVLDLEPLAAPLEAEAAADDADAFRTGFDQYFLDFRMPVPTFIKERRTDLADLDGDQQIRY